MQVYQSLSAAQIIARVANEGLRPPVPPRCPWNHVMQMCWHEDPAARPTFEQILVELKHILAQHTTSPYRNYPEPNLYPTRSRNHHPHQQQQQQQQQQLYYHQQRQGARVAVELTPPTAGVGGGGGLVTQHRPQQQAVEVPVSDRAPLLGSTQPPNFGGCGASSNTTGDTRD